MIAYPGDEWWWYRNPSISLGSSTVTRVKEDDEPDPEFRPRPVEKEPRVWEGDGA